MSKQSVFTWPIRVYFQDTDAGGVVYHTSYVNFMEHARTEWLRSHGLSHACLIEEFGVMFVVRAIKIDYLKPARLDDMLDVTAKISELGRCRLNMLQSVHRLDETVTTAEVELVCVSKEIFKPVSMPDALRAKLNY
jgi:acyl-CoA thioester hydrolase